MGAPLSVYSSLLTIASFSKLIKGRTVAGGERQAFFWLGPVLRAEWRSASSRRQAACCPLCLGCLCSGPPTKIH